jgi:cytochrome c oxidase assembly protein subunit 15
VRHRYAVLVAAVLAQGALGGAQYALGVPEVLAALHVLGAGLVTVAAAVVWAALTERPAPAVASGRTPPEPTSRSRPTSPC